MSPISLRRSLTAAASLAALTTLSGCISFGEKPPAQLLGLTSDAKVPVGTTKASRDVDAVSVAIPMTPGALRNQRVAVLSGADFAYLPKAVWVDVPARLFRDVVAETIEAKTSKFVPDARNAAITPNTRLAGTLSAFELLGGQGKVLVIYDATLAKAGSDVVRTRRFEATSPVSSEEPASVTAALNRAANAVASDVAAWVSNPAG